jgi:hypothetical protein
MTILANCKIISATGKGILFGAKGAVSLQPAHRPRNSIGYKPALKAQFNPDPGPDLAVNRAFSAGNFRIPTILGRCPRVSMNVAPLARSEASQP